MTTPSLQEIAEQQRESWDRFAPGWKKWDAVNMQFLKPVADVMIECLALQADHHVLDIACGTGEPGLSIAEIVEDGRVVGMDISTGMLAVAHEHAETRGIDNFESHSADVSSLPFDDDSFDAISCRMGFMFFPDIQKTLQEMHRVLKPGGRFSASVWAAPQQNFWVTVTMGTISEYLQLDPPPANAPGMFRCAGPDFMASRLEQAGFRNIEVSEVSTGLSLDPETYWEMITEVGAPIVAALNQADESTRQQIKQSVLEKIHEKFPDGNFHLDACALVIAAEA